MTDTPFSRVLLKLSGESLMGEAGYGMDPPRIAEIAYAIQQVRDEGVEVAIVVGGGKAVSSAAQASTELNAVKSGGTARLLVLRVPRGGLHRVELQRDAVLERDARRRRDEPTA